MGDGTLGSLGPNGKEVWWWERVEGAWVRSGPCPRRGMEGVGGTRALWGSLTAPPQGPAPPEFPGARPGAGDVDQAHLAGFPSPRTHGQADGAAVSGYLLRGETEARGHHSTSSNTNIPSILPTTTTSPTRHPPWDTVGVFLDPGDLPESPLLLPQHVGLHLQHHAALDHRGALPAAPGCHPLSPPGVPGPGRALGGADAEGSRAHHRPGDPAQGGDAGAGMGAGGSVCGSC